MANESSEQLLKFVEEHQSHEFPGINVIAYEYLKRIQAPKNIRRDSAISLCSGWNHGALDQRAARERLRRDASAAAIPQVVINRLA